MDWMDDLLEGLPFEAPSQGLNPLIKARLVSFRSRARWGKRVTMAAAFVVGILGMRIAVAGMLPQTPHFSRLSLRGLQEALLYFVRSPMEASVDLGQLLVAWQSDFVGSMDLASILSLSVVSLVALYGILRLLNLGETERKVLQ
jgi:hypothetical protein